MSKIKTNANFRSAMANILELMDVEKLYGTSKWAYRELLHNSFDAVNEKIAYKILKKKSDPFFLRRELGTMEIIEITVEKRKDGLWLICKDNGVGM